MAALEAIDRSFNEWITAREAHDTGVWKKLRERIAAAEKQLQEREQQLNRRQAELDAREERLKKQAETATQSGVPQEDQVEGDAQPEGTNVDAAMEPDPANEEPEAVPAVTSKEAVKINAAPPTELDRICRLGTAKDLADHLGQRKKQDVAFIAKPLGVALLKAESPCRLVLDVLSGLTEEMFNEKPAKKEAIDRARRVCSAVLEGFAEAKVSFAELTDADEAKRIADDWHARMEGRVTSFDPMCAGSFVALVAAFAISSRYPAEFVEAAVVHAFGKRANFAVLRSLSFDDRIPGILKKLVEGGKFPVALRMMREFKLFSVINVAGLLNKFVTHAAANPTHKGAELAAYKTCVRFVEENNLGDKVALAPFQRRIEALEAARANRQNEVAKRVAAKKLPMAGPPSMLPQPPPAKFARYQEPAPYEPPFEPPFEPRQMAQGSLARAPPAFGRELVDRPQPAYGQRMVEYEAAPPAKLTGTPYGSSAMYRSAPAGPQYSSQQYPSAARADTYAPAAYTESHERDPRPVYRNYEIYPAVREEPAYGLTQRYRL